MSNNGATALARVASSPLRGAINFGEAQMMERERAPYLLELGSGRHALEAHLLAERTDQ